MAAGSMSTCGYSRCRFLTAWNEDRDAFFLYYKDDFNFEQEVVSLPDVIETQISEEENKDYPNVRHTYIS